ncbi:I78 family peptidase inhibitor [Gymnodinialimonas ceratoperidinii]|uniref:Uncharacterized protein n=1 Tax=Gymnodinialimonas ceratoperidinii TaxID=2856823 RepID=A0A8F6TVW4_9RHOB|nr:I78 family peptidase inhibitor [Gymnodinialimonas ceratoperidinii]QXT39896.1 hypothetical protein KYE46_01140 [Gymnodinialimonas ceratoperidinii]
MSQFEYLVGQPVSLARSQGLQARYFSPGAGNGTMDYRPERLNIWSNADAIITRVYCG